MYEKGSVIFALILVVTNLLFVPSELEKGTGSGIAFSSDWNYIARYEQKSDLCGDV